MIKLERYRGMYVRQGFAVDREMIRQSQTNYRHFDALKGAIVMDWGMNVGGFGAMMLRYPIAQYIGVECHPDNFIVAQKNLAHDARVTLINAAVVAGDESSVSLFLTRSKQAMCSGTVHLKSQGAKSLRPVELKVDAVNAARLLEEYQPSHLKIDVEGAEYPIMESMGWKVPQCVKQMALEFHWPEKVMAYEDTFRKDLVADGFEPVDETVNYVGGDNELSFLGRQINYRNIWGMDCFYRR